MNSLRGEILENLLYMWVDQKKIPHIRPGMVEDVEKFILSIMAEVESNKAAERMVAQTKEGEKSNG